MCQKSAPPEGSVLGYLLAMRRGIGFPSHGNVLGFLNRHQWLNGSINLMEKVGEKFDVLPPPVFARLSRVHAWLEKLTYLTELHGDVITQEQLLSCAPSVYNRVYTSPRTAIRTAFDLYAWLHSADRTTGLTVYFNDDGYVVTEPRKYLPPTPLRWTMLRRCSHEPTRKAVRQAYLTYYLPLLRTVVWKMSQNFPRHVEVGDLVGSATIGLCEAFEHFDPSQGVKFQTYAVPRIRGAVLDSLRDQDWAPRSVRSTARKVDFLVTQLAAEIGCIVPTYEQIADRLSIPYEQVVKHFVDIQQVNVASTDDIVFDDDSREVSRLETIIVPRALQDEQLSWRQVWGYVQYLMRTCLTPQERTVIDLYYLHEYTLKRIGERLLISESRVSQIHTKALARLRHACMEHFQIVDPQRWYEELVLGH